MARRAGVLAATTAAVVIGAAGPAAADVTVNPASAVQGSGENLYFSVPNGCAGPAREISLQIPADAPIAEVYPLSVNDWAPNIVWRDLSTAIQPIHGSSPVTQVPSTITWLSVGQPLAAGQTAELPIAAGPLPLLSSVTFTVQTACADGSKAADQTATLTLTPGTGAPAAGSHHGGATTTDTQLTPAEQAAFDKILDDASAGPSLAAISGWVVAALALLGAGWVMLRNRRRPEPEAPEETASSAAADEDKEPVAVGAGKDDNSKWAFKG